MIMKKTVILTILILVVASGGVFAGGLDFQIGAGYNGYFMGENDVELNYPLGFTAYGGVGYKFLPTLSIGAEYEFGMSWATNDLDLGKSFGLIEHMPKAYIKFNALNILAITGLAGVDVLTHTVDGEAGIKETAFTAGARVALLFGYAQYMMVFNTDRVDHRISAGISLSK
jgi:hypothetical protein